MTLNICQNSNLLFYVKHFSFDRTFCILHSSFYFVHVCILFTFVFCIGVFILFDCSHFTLKFAFHLLDDLYSTFNFVFYKCSSLYFFQVCIVHWSFHFIQLYTFYIQVCISFIELFANSTFKFVL